MRIERLSERVANRIAAGEVITEPLSVIKELVENSLDAGARRIDIEIRSGGLEKISIVDDGEGIFFDDAPLVFERHATSKLRNVSDLYEIESMGFRGEALASVAAVSKVTLQSRSQQEQQGFEMLVYGGNALSLQRIARDKGTRIDVEDLFYNTPVLGNFQKRQSILEGRITEFVSAFAVGNPQIAITYTVDHRRFFSTRGDENEAAAILSVFGEEALTHLIEFSMNTESFRVKGMQSSLGYSFPHRRRMIFFVNGRLVENPELRETLNKAYDGLLPARRFPMAVMWIFTNPGGVDVNLHPRKEHVRLYYEKELLQPLREALRRNLYQERAIPPLPVSNQKGPETSFIEEDADDEDPPDFSSFSYFEQQVKQEEVIQQVREPIGTVESFLDVLHYLGSFKSAYLIFEGRDSMYIMDQHAAHEKILYETFTDAYKRRELHSQGLLVAMTISVGAQERETWNRYRDDLHESGFETELFGEQRLIIRSIPHVFTQAQAKQYLLDYLAGSPDRSDITREEMMRKACKAAIKAGDAIVKAEVRQLIEGLKKAEDPMTCPHGRPIFIKLSLSELEKRFARI